MILQSALDWLGLRRAELAVGVHLTSDYVTVAAVRSDPLRVVAIGRSVVADAAVVDDEIRLVAAVSVELRTLAEAMGLASDATTVVTVEPSASAIDLSTRAGGAIPECPVRRAVNDRAVEAVTRAGLRLVRVDAVPAALARLSSLFPATEPIALALGGRWTVVGRPGSQVAFSDGAASGWRGLQVGPSAGGLAPLSALPTIRIPRSLRSEVDVGTDGFAIGAALAGLGVDPLILVRPDDGARTDHWSAQAVTTELDKLPTLTVPNQQLDQAQTQQVPAHTQHAPTEQVPAHQAQTEQVPAHHPQTQQIPTGQGARR